MQKQSPLPCIWGWGKDEQVGLIRTSLSMFIGLLWDKGTELC